MSRHGAKSRYNFKRDANEDPIVGVLQAQGFHVTKINGWGVPDLLVSRAGRVWLIEVKQAKGKMQERQEKWHRDWQGPVPIVVRSIEDAQHFALLAMEGGGQ